MAGTAEPEQSPDWGIAVRVTDGVVELLEDSGMEVVFGLPCEQLEAYYASLADSDLRHVLGRSEAGAAIMADGYARKARQAAVVDGVGGPGATNTAIGLIEAHGASSPVVALTGDNSRAFRGNEAIQDADNAAILDPFVSASADPESPARLIDAVTDALRESVAGVPGPTHVNLPEDLLDEELDTLDEGGVSCTYPRDRPTPGPDRVEAAVDSLQDAERPIIVAGEGAVRSGAFDAIDDLASTAAIPVVTSMNAKGIVAETAPYALGVTGRWGYSEPANDALEAADVVLALGARLGELTTNRWRAIDPSATIVQVDLDPHWLGRTYDVAVPILADVRAAVQAITEAYEGPGGVDRTDRLDALAEEYDQWRTGLEDAFTSAATPIAPERIIHELQSALPSRSVLVSATSFPGFFSAAYYEVTRPGVRYIQSRGSDGINYALPHGIGVQLATQTEPVVVVTGDGGIGYHIAELETAAREHVPVTVIVFNNQSLRSSKLSQIGGYNVDVSTDFDPATDYATVAEGFGCTGHRVEEPAVLADTLPRAIASEDPVLLDVQVDPHATPPLQLL
ncbi:MAG: thiamine pyrophosphate-binding protein [Halobacteriaceae archaeon]